MGEREAMLRWLEQAFAAADAAFRNGGYSGYDQGRAEALRAAHQALSNGEHIQAQPGIAAFPLGE